MPVRALLVLKILALSSEPAAEGTAISATVALGLLAVRFLILFGAGHLVEGNLQVNTLVLPRDFDADGLARQTFADFLLQICIGMDGGTFNSDDDITYLKSRRFRRPVLGDVGQTRPDLDILGAKTGKCRILGLLADLFGLQHHISDVGIRPVEIETDAPDVDSGQPCADFRKGLTPIRGFMQTASRSPLLFRRVAVETVALTLVGGDQQGVGIGRMHLDIDDPGVLIDIENLLPGFAGIGGFIKAAFLVGAPEPAQSADVDDIRIEWMNGDPPDLEGLVESHVLEGLAPID